MECRVLSLGTPGDGRSLPAPEKLNCDTAAPLVVEPGGVRVRVRAVRWWQ